MAGTVLYKDVLLPFVAMMFAATAILVAWTIHDPPQYATVAFVDDPSVYQEDAEANQTMKMCYRNPVYNNILISLMIVSGMIALWMAWKTKNVREDLSDSSRVIHTIVCHLIIDLLLVALFIPVANHLESFSLLTAAVLITGFLTAMVPLGFVILPKIYYARVEYTTGELPEGIKTIGGGAVRVTGLTEEELKPEVGINCPSSMSS
ncbi:MAG: hypothetical protein SGILL_005211 [Bacillariaceae sp.]